MMESYTDFSKVYDTFMDETPYNAWCEYILSTLKEYGVTSGVAVDLGCGTGCMTQRLATAGFDMIGVDLSEEMLAIALEKKEQTKQDILYLCQDMRAFELYGTVAMAVSVCDSMNYLLNDADVIATLKTVNNYLDPNGIFIFDFNTNYYYRDVIGDTVIAENREDCSFIWENFYDDKLEQNEYELTIFVKEDDLYRKFQEVHYQRGYDIEHMKSLVAQSGLELLQVNDGYTNDQATKTSQRITMVCRECEK